MDLYKPSKYFFSEEIQPGIFLYYSSLSNEFLLLPLEKHLILEGNTPEEICEAYPDLFNLLVERKFFVKRDFDETKEVTEYRQKSIHNEDWYNVVINTTLDCNLDCWYCYENKIKGSRLSDNVIDNICEHIKASFKTTSYSSLKITFFGGEPFMNWKGIKSIISFADSFCKEQNISLLLEFTTNATLITESMVEFLKDFSCLFQITLDGSEHTHNEIKKHVAIPNFNSYKKTLHALELINSHIPNRNIAVRINFDNRALKEIDTIINDISFLDRTKCYVIVKKVWQVETSDVDKESLLTVIQKLLDADFLPDYYVMPKGGVCFAERKNQVLFNFDGNIFKCTTICSFDKNNSLGVFNSETSMIDWDEQKITPWLNDLPQQECMECKWYGACLGPCNRQILAHKGTRLCTFDAMNLSHKEYLMYLFKYNLLHKKLFKAK